MRIAIIFSGLIPRGQHYKDRIQCKQRFAEIFPDAHFYEMAWTSDKKAHREKYIKFDEMQYAGHPLAASMNIWLGRYYKNIMDEIGEKIFKNLIRDLKIKRFKKNWNQHIAHVYMLQYLDLNNYDIIIRTRYDISIDLRIRDDIKKIIDATIRDGAVFCTMEERSKSTCIYDKFSSRFYTNENYISKFKSIKKSAGDVIIFHRPNEIKFDNFFKMISQNTLGWGEPAWNATMRGMSALYLDRNNLWDYVKPYTEYSCENISLLRAAKYNKSRLCTYQYKFYRHSICLKDRQKEYRPKKYIEKKQNIGKI